MEDYKRATKSGKAKKNFDLHGKHSARHTRRVEELLDVQRAQQKAKEGTKKN